jgi:hypothetical protein
VRDGNVSRNGVQLVLYGGLEAEVGQSLLITVERIGPTPVSFRVQETARFVTPRDASGGLRTGVSLSLDAPCDLAKSIFT